MKITCIASGSKGNAYLINDGVSTLLVECGVKLDMIKKATNYKLSGLAEYKREEKIFSSKAGHDQESYELQT